jgi:hypothetical protein
MVEHEMSDLSDASNNLNEMPVKMKTKVYNHYVIQNEIETQSKTSKTAVLILELAAVIKSSSFDELVFKNVLLDTGCFKTLLKANRLPKQYLKTIVSPTKRFGTRIQGVSKRNLTSNSPFFHRFCSKQTN